MASFQAKIGWKKHRNSEDNNYRTVPLQANPQDKISKKQQIKYKKLKSTAMASFEAKIGWKSLRKRENEHYCSVPFRSNSTRKTKFQKNSKNFQKIKKHHQGFISSQNRLEKAEKKRK